MTVALIAIAVLVALPGIATSVHLSVLCFASVAFRNASPPMSARQRYLVLVPARNEESVLPQTLASLKAATRDGDTILVIADRCTDSTADIARRAGVMVLERSMDAEAGKAAALEDGKEHAQDLDWTALTVIDADSLVNGEFFSALDAALGHGRQLAQPRSEHIRRRGVLARVSEAAFSMQGVALPRGRQVLGIGVRLRGTGMTMLRDVAERVVPTTGGASEDLFMSLDLLLDGLVAFHVDDARLESHSAPTIRSGGAQRIRWEQGRIAAARRYVGPLMRKRSRSSLEAAVLLSTPPFAVAVFLVLVGSGLLFAAGATVAAVVVAIFAALLAVDLAIALVEARAPLATWLSLVVAPFYIVWKVAIQVMAIARSGRASQAWEPTSRE